MAGTAYSSVFDLFMMQLTDYRLINLYNTSETDFANYLQGFMVLAIAEFYNCGQNLEDRNDTSQAFNFDMTSKNQQLLSKLMIKAWLTKEVRNVLQMNMSITDRDFKHYAEANNLNAKQNALSVLNEECYQALVAYGLKNNQWDAWASQNFSG